MAKTQEDRIKYCECMEDVKRRIAVIRQFVGEGNTLGREDFDYELVCIHLRKILELIAFGSLIANQEKYSEAHENYIKHRKIDPLLDNIAKLNPDFYPKPLKPPITLSSGGKHFEDSDKNFLTRDEFTKLLNLCNLVLHVWNPYTPRERKVNFEIPVLEWVNKIQCLLDIHCIRLVGQDVMVVVMNEQHDGKVHAYYGAGVPESATQELNA